MIQTATAEQTRRVLRRRPRYLLNDIAGLPFFDLANVFAAGTTPFSLFGAPSVQIWVTAKKNVTVGGGFVTNWADQTANANNFSAAGAARPAYNTNPLNGNPTIRFGGSHSMLCANYLLDPAPACFAAVVVPRSSAGGLPQAIYSSDAAFYQDLTSGAEQWGLYNLAPSATLSLATPYALIGNVHTAGNSDQYTNGVLQAALAGYANNNRGATRIGSDAGGGVQFLNADLCELIKLNRAATPAEITALRAYFTGQWGFAA